MFYLIKYFYCLFTSLVLIASRILSRLIVNEPIPSLAKEMPRLFRRYVLPNRPCTVQAQAVLSYFFLTQNKKIMCLFNWKIVFSSSNLWRLCLRRVDLRIA